MMTGLSELVGESLGKVLNEAKLALLCVVVAFLSKWCIEIVQNIL